MVALPGTAIDRMFWYGWVVQFLVYEGMGLVRSKDTTLTRLTLATVPRWMLAMFLGWLSYHFLIQYR